MCCSRGLCNMSLVLPIIVLVLLAYKIYSYVTGKPGKSPPGVPRLPIWGSYWFLLWGDYKFPYKTVAYYVKKYKSKIVSLYLGSFYTIVVNDYQGIKEVLSRKEFDGRLGNNYVVKARAFGKQLGIFFNDDADWLVQRRFALRTLRDFGFGRRHEKCEKLIIDQVQILVDALKDGPHTELDKTVVNDGTAYFPDVLFPSAANAIWFVMTGVTYKPEDYEILRNLCRYAMIFQRSGDTTGGAIVQTPWLRFFGKKGFGLKDFIKGTCGMSNFVQAFVDNRKTSNDDEQEAKGFVDVYLNKLKESELTSGFSEEQLLIVAVDMMFPALSAVPSLLTHIIKRTMHKPEVMEKVQREIDNVVGRSRLPNWNDRINLPYTEATIRETMRMETLTPWSLAHRAIENTTLMGYDVPADTTVITNLAAMHNDPDLWGDPENFRPERFLTEDGQRLGKDNTIPFGFGRRVCAGETFARFILFAHFAALAQNFNFYFVDGQPTKLDDVFSGLITTPKETWITVTPR